MNHKIPASIFVRTNCCSRLLFCWSCSYLKHGRLHFIPAIKQIFMSSDDMLNIFDSQKANVLAEQLESAWLGQRKKDLPSLGKALWKVFWKKLMIVALLAFLAESFVGIGFFLMSSIIGDLVDGVLLEESDPSLTHGLILSSLFTILTLFLVFLRHNYQMRNSTVFVEIRQALTGLIYRKSLRLSLRSLSTFITQTTVLINLIRTTSGKIINAVSSDLTVLDQGHIFVTHLLFEPFVALIHLTLISLIVGLDILWGVIVMIAVIASQLLFACCLKSLRKQVSTFTDQRLKLLESILSGIRIIKAYTWEVILKNRVLALRNKEYKFQLLLNFIKSSSFSILRFCGYVAVALVFYIKSARGETLEPGPSFAALATFNFLAFYVCLFMGYGITTLAEFGITLDRIKEVLLAEEKNSESQHIGILTTIRGFHPRRVNDLVSKPAITFEDVTISWGEKRETKKQRDVEILTDSMASAESTTKRLQHKKRSLFSSAAKTHTQSSIQRHLTHIDSEFEKILNRVCLKIMPGELVGLIGPTGSGKTSLLHAIMGENFIIGEGQIHFGNESPKISYVPQEPFILADSLQNNITFGLKYCQDRFKKVIACASLEEDIESLENGQFTIIGEKGDTLSGGQRARVALARALYSEADIYLLDDPLSAVDAKVSARIMSTVRQELKGKTRILVTHQSHVLSLMDRVIYLDNNEVKFFGTPSDLSKIERALDHMMDEQKEEFEQEHQYLIKIRSESVKEDQFLRDNSVSDVNSTRRELEFKVNAEVTPRTRKLSIFKEIKEKFSGNRNEFSIDQEENPNDEVLKAAFYQMPTQKSQKLAFSKEPEGIRRLIPVNVVNTRDGFNSDFNCKNICQFIRYSLGPFTGLVLALSSIAPALFNLYVSEWLREWVDQPSEEQTAPYYRNIFVLVVLAFLALTLLRNFVVGSLTLFQNKKLHDHMLKSIVRAKIAFFDQNPSSIVLSRFSKDLSVGDITMPVVSTWFSQFFFRVISVFVVLCYVVPWMIFPICLVIFFTFLLRKFLARIMCEALKLETLTRAPVTGFISTSLTGLVSIRTYAQEQFFLHKFNIALDFNTRAFTTFHIITRTFTLSLDILSATVIIFSLFTAFFVRTKDNVLLLAMAIQMANDLMGTFQTSIRLSSDLQGYMANINRCLQYTRAIPEAPLSTYQKQKQSRHKNKYRVAPGLEKVQVDEYKAEGPETCRARKRQDYKVQLIEKQILNEKGGHHKTWVMQGMISFRHAMMRYKANSDPALNDVNIKIPGGCKVGIVGRTGSGKSSIINALFRIVELEQFNDGGIKIDHIDISKLGLHALRRNISLIPQTPFLFEGTLRQNLDPGVPQSAQNDSRIWSAIDQVDLAQYIMSLPLRLDTWCGEGNLHFSVGQKQQLCLARALLKKNKILVMDQATANIDPGTQSIISDIIRRQFVECTVIIVAHRLKTIIECDMVVVMDQGRCVEQGTPFELLVKNPNDNDITAETMFADLVSEQVSQREMLFEKARDAYFRRNMTI